MPTSCTNMILILSSEPSQAFAVGYLHTASNHRPDYHFGTSRQHWYANYGDAGVPSGFLREHLNGIDPILTGPNTAFAASACPRIYFAARYVMTSPPAYPQADLYWETNNSGGFGEHGNKA